MNSRLFRPARTLATSIQKRNLTYITVLWLFCMMLSLHAFGQEATIVGTVTDPSGSVVRGVKIAVTRVETGETRSVDTNDTGQYVAADLPIGHYNISARGSGFKLAEHKDLMLNVGDRARVDFQMQLGGATETVTVEANAIKVQSDSGEVSDVINGQQITQLATNGRSVFELEALTPGASSIQADFQVPTSAGGDFNVSFNGQRVSHNLWLIDGGEAADRGGGGGSDVLPSMDAIAEFRTMTSNYSAEYGLSSAGTMTMAIKSGTKQLHATAFYFGRNDAFDARNYFNPAPNPVAELRFNDWGFNVGGPVIFKKTANPKTFFFYNMEWRRYIQGGLFNVTVPLASMYPDANGAGSGAVIPSTLANGSMLQMVVPTGVVGLGANCPGGKPPAGIVPGQPFPNNTIPDCMIDPNANSLLKAGIFNKPNNGWQFIGGNKQPTTGKEEIARIDHQFTDKFSIFGHWISDQAIQTYGTTQWSSDNVPTVFNTFNNPSYSAVIHTTYVISPTLLNEVAFNYDGNRIHIIPAGVFAAPSDFTEGKNRIFTGPNVDNRIPDIHLSGSTGSFYTANWTPWNNTANDYQVRDDLSWAKGAHQLKFGFSWALYKKAQDYFAVTQGGFGFNGSFTAPSGCTTSTSVTCGLDFADFLLGYAQSYNENAIKSTGYWNNISPAAYVQDNWRATSRLTLNLGLRWDGIPHTYEANNRMSNFYPNLYNFSNKPIFANAADTQIAANSPGLGTSSVAELQGYQFYLNGMGIEGTNGVPKGLVNNTWDAFGPRVGLAYDVTGTGKTVVRGGFGIMYERIQGNDMYNAATNPPWGYGLNTNNVLFSNPHDSATGGAITVPIVTASVTGLNQHYPVPTTYQYSAGIQQAIGKNAVFSASYVGNQGRHQSYLQELELPPASDLACLQSSASCAGAQPAFNGLVTYPGYNSLKMAFDGANSHYNSLQAELRGRVTRDLTLQAAYTLSRSIDPSTGDNNGSNGWDLDQVSNPYVGWKYDMGPSTFDRTNIAFVNFVYDIPVLRNSSSKLLKTAFGGWQLSGIVTMESGTPLNLSLSGQNVASIFPGNDVMNRPDANGNVSYPHTAAQWFNPAAFSAPAAGTWGDLGFNALRGPGRDNWNMSLFKSFVLSESRGSRFEFRVESFNTWNHTQFGASGTNGGISTAFGSSNFGAVTNAYDPRVFQFGGKLIF